ncbi:MAG: dihydroneopterin aldolase [Sulfurimonas sp.]|nr:dihydroneopterin aldolase [Sulfurimonas sp.]MDQ7062471.1 dihydroneopterin aldolase [Sulfurimonas sp.]
MTIYIEDLRFQCIIGILDYERLSPQDIIINIEIDYTYENDFINYAELSNFTKSLMINNKFLLIEDALLTLATKLKEEFSKIEKLRLKITKPSILPDCKVSVSNSSCFIS